jgi:hypothetical protein
VDRETDLLGGFEIDYQLEFGRLIDGRVPALLPLEAEISHSGAVVAVQRLIKHLLDLYALKSAAGHRNVTEPFDAVNAMQVKIERGSSSLLPVEMETIQTCPISNRSGSHIESVVTTHRAEGSAAEFTRVIMATVQAPAP